MKCFVVGWNSRSVHTRFLAGSVAKKIGWGIQPWSQSCQRNGKTAFPQSGRAVGVRRAQQGQFGGVHNVHTLGFGSGCVMSRDMGDGFVSGDR